MTFVQLLQIASGAAWLIVALWMVPSIVRLFRRREYRYDPLRSCFFFMGLLQAGFAVRWAMYPRTIAGMASDELMMWQGLYALSCLLAGWSLYVARAYGRGDCR